MDYITKKPEHLMDVALSLLCLIDVMTKFYPKDYLKQYQTIMEKLANFKKYHPS